MITLGITGGIGSGKSVVCRLFSMLDVPVFIADIESKRLLNTHLGVRELLQQEFGTDIYAGCFIDKRRFAEAIFADSERLQKANKIIHPAVREAFVKWKNAQSAPIVIEEAAVLFESGTYADMDYTLTVAAPELLRMQRVRMRDGLTPDQVALRMKHQLPDEDKILRSDFVIRNDDESALIPQVQTVFNAIINANTI